MSQAGARKQPFTTQAVFFEKAPKKEKEAPARTLEMAAVVDGYPTITIPMAGADKISAMLQVMKNGSVP